jgi:hypothetical protein
VAGVGHQLPLPVLRVGDGGEHEVEAVREPRQLVVAVDLDRPQVTSPCHAFGRTVQALHGSQPGARDGGAGGRGDHDTRATDEEQDQRQVGELLLRRRERLREHQRLVVVADRDDTHVRAPVGPDVERLLPGGDRQLVPADRRQVVVVADVRRAVRIDQRELQPAQREQPGRELRAGDLVGEQRSVDRVLRLPREVDVHLGVQVLPHRPVRAERDQRDRARDTAGREQRHPGAQRHPFLPDGRAADEHHGGVSRRT